LKSGSAAGVVLTTMSIGSHLARFSCVAAIALGTAVVVPPATGQTRRAAGAEEIEVDPIQCWWKTGQTAVIIGERFTVTLTCRVIETSGIHVVANRDQLEPAALQLTPFDVVGGARHQDILASPWRYFQYEYTVRLLGAEFFGHDVEVPPTSVAYNIVSAENDTEGRDQAYLLPALPMRIMSLVPGKTTDIRDASQETFAAIEARRFRARTEMVAAAISFGFAVVLAGFALARTVVAYRAREPLVTRRVAPRVVLAAALGSLRQVKAEVARHGWSAERVARALAALRVAAAVALGRPVAQAEAAPDDDVREGQVAVRWGILRPMHLRVSAATRADAIDRHRSGPATHERSDDARPLDQIAESLRIFGAARYRREGPPDDAALDEALERSARAIRRLRMTARWPRRVRGTGASAASFVGVRR
jgi:hypothetical protein